MSDSIVRAIPSIADAPKPTISEWKPNERAAQAPEVVEEPLDNTEEAILASLGIDDPAKTLPTEDINNLKEIEGYLTDILKNKGVTPTKSTVAKELTKLREDMGLDENAEPAVVLDRVGGVIKAWKQLSFITNPNEKRSLFMKLANANDSKEMNRLVFEEMNRRTIWR